MPLGMEVGLGLHIVLDGDPAPPQKGAQQPPPQFSAVCAYCGQTVAHLSNCWALVLRAKYFSEYSISMKRLCISAVHTGQVCARVYTDGI